MKNNDKEELRLYLKEKRKNISEKRRKDSEQKILDDLYPSLAGYSTVLSFASFGDEINMWPLNEILCGEKRLLLPKIHKDTLEIYYIENLEKDLIKGKWNIWEPNTRKAEKQPFSQVYCALIPGLGFDSQKHRIGYGKGHYDRLLEALENCVKVGVGFKEQLCEDLIPTKMHDQKLDHVLLF